MSVGDALESVAVIVIIASLAIGFYESSNDLGEMTSLLDSAIDAPSTFGAGLAIFTLSLDTWTPGIPVESLPIYLQWLAVPYFFTDGYIPHYSMWTAMFAFVVAAVVTLLVLKFTEIEFQWRGLLIGVITFVGCWYAYHLVSWAGMGFGADLMGLGSATAYTIWRNAVSSTDGPLLQYFFFGTIPLSAYLLYKKVATHLI